jgi:hypothetical protein
MSMRSRIAWLPEKLHEKALAFYEKFSDTCNTYNAIIKKAPAPENFDKVIQYRKGIEEKKGWRVK